MDGGGAAAVADGSPQWHACEVRSPGPPFSAAHESPPHDAPDGHPRRTGAVPWAREGGDDAERRDAERAGRGRAVGGRDVRGFHVIARECTLCRVVWARGGRGARVAAQAGFGRDADSAG